jgi:hypothetical protein
MKRMVLVAATIIALVVIAIGVADPIGARPDKRLIPEGSFRITAQEVLRDDDTLVSRIEIETHPGAIVSMSTTGPMPPTNAKVSEVLAVTAQSGVYPEGGPIPVVTFTGTIYSLVVERPRR